MGSSNQLLSIEALERDLASAEQELARAAAETARANEAEIEWQTEVTSLKNLIQVRKKRRNPTVAPEIIADNGLDDFEEGVNVAVEVPNDADLNKVDWIGGLIAASGTLGVAPPEIMKAAEKRHIKMHPNYPYVVLRKLVEKGRAVKRKGRYYKN